MHRRHFLATLAAAAAGAALDPDQLLWTPGKAFFHIQQPHRQLIEYTVAGLKRVAFKDGQLDAICIDGHTVTFSASGTKDTTVLWGADIKTGKVSIELQNWKQRPIGGVAHHVRGVLGDFHRISRHGEPIYPPMRIY